MPNYLIGLMASREEPLTSAARQAPTTAAGNSRRVVIFAAASLALAVLAGCASNAAPPEASPTAPTASRQVPTVEASASPEDPTPSQTAAAQTVFFAHNSVGQNIVDGLRATAADLTIETGEQAGGAAFTEWTMGFNGEPAAKLAEFERLMAGGGAEAQLAIFKFCYADFQADTNVDQLFSQYVATFDRLEQTYPAVTFIHVTAPLYAFDASWNNAVQHAFNERLRAKYGQAVFDLAALEATDAAGQTVLARDGVTPAMAEDWSADGGHLNEAGSRYVAAALLDFLGGAE